MSNPTSPDASVDQPADPTPEHIDTAAYVDRLVEWARKNGYRLYENVPSTSDTFDAFQTNANWMRGYDEAKPDMVNAPPHYQSDSGIECIDAIRAALGREGFIAYCKGQVMKYNWRAGSKWDAVEDAKKAAWYQDRMIKEMEVKNDD